MEPKKAILKSLVMVAMVSWTFSMAFLPTVAAETSTPTAGTTTTATSGDSKDKNVKDATSVSGCKGDSGKGFYTIPSNCLFLEEPIGGKPGYDLYYVHCEAGGTGTPGKLGESGEQGYKEAVCKYRLWSGKPIDKPDRGPIQAVLTRQAGKEFQGPFGLLYNYLSLIYTYMSGLIIGISVLFVVIGGIQIATSGGESDGVTKGKKRIVQAITGVILWFTASLILYTINPTFFGY